MTIIEAIKSGQPFKLSYMPDYLCVKRPDHATDHICYWYYMKQPCSYIPVKALIADNWELMEVPDNVIKFTPRGTA